jgi:thymidine phosphorylase
MMIGMSNLTLETVDVCLELLSMVRIAPTDAKAEEQAAKTIKAVRELLELRESLDEQTSSTRADANVP